MKMNKKVVSYVLIGVSAAILVAFTILFFKTVTIKGNQVGVLETWGGGVQDEILTPKTYMYIPGFFYTVYPYDISAQVVELDKSQGDSYHVQSAEGQDMEIEMSLRYRIDSKKIVENHKTVGEDFDQKVIIPTLLRVIKDHATNKKAIDAYSGEGLVRLQKEIEDSLVGHQEYLEKGVIVENCNIKHIGLDPNYLTEIQQKQVAIQKELRFKQEELAALAEAKKAKAEAQANYEKTVVEAQRDKEVALLKAQQEAESSILAAEAKKKQVVMSAEAEKESGILRAESILAMGKAEADALKLKLQSYAVPGSDLYAKIQVAESLKGAFSNIKGYLPADMRINVLTESFSKSLQAVVDVGEGNK